MNDMKCQIQSHNGQKIKAVCMDKQCKIRQRLCCHTCLITHNTHQNKSVDIDEMNNFIQQERDKQGPQSCSFGQKQIIQGLEKLNSLVDSLKKIIKEKLEKTKQQNLQDYLNKSINNQQGIEYWNQLFEEIVQYVEVDNCLIQQTKEGQLNKMEEKEIQIINESEQSLQSLLSKFNQIAKPQINNDSPTQQQIIQQTQIKIESPIQIKIGKLCFKDDRKHVDIAIISESIIKSKKSRYLYAMAFANEGFDPSNQSYEFAFKILNYSIQMFVGVGNNEKGKGQSYNFNNYSTLGHGQYVIHCIQNGTQNQTFHHTDQEFNYKPKGITFKTGDKIQIKYDHVTKELEFKNTQSGKDNVLKMPITDMTSKLYPCAFLFNNDDSVQLVEY